MSYKRTSVMAAFPYFTKKTVQNDDDRNLMEILWAIKDGRPLTVNGRTVASGEWFVDAFTPDARDRSFLNRTRTLVPIPQSSVTKAPADRRVWPGFDVASGLAEKGYARECRPLLGRINGVRSSREARAAGEDPPSVLEHADSMGVDPALLAGVQAITLVDDVVSAGRNSMGAAECLRRAGFNGDIRLLAVSYTTYTAGLRESFYGRVIWKEGERKSFRKSLAENGEQHLLPADGPWVADPPNRIEEW